MTTRKKSNRREKRTGPAKGARADGFMSSPIRIVILCVAVLMISVSGGILIGKIFGPNGAPDHSATETASAGHAGEPPAALDSRTRDPRPVAKDTNRSVSALETPPPPYGRVLPTDLTASASPPPLPYEEALPGQVTAPQRDAGEEEFGTSSRALPDASPEFTGSPAWKRYAALSPDPDGRPMIAIVIDDVGLNMQRVRDLNALPALLTLSFLPYAPGLQEKVDIARSEGNEVMLHLPMEPTNGSVNPGPDALLTSLDEGELLRRTRDNLDRFTGYVGVNNHMGSRFTADEQKMALVMDEMAKRGLLFLDSKTTSASAGYRLSVERGMPSAKRDYFIDHVIDEPTILAQLAKVEASALRHGVVIAIGHPHPETISALRKWIPEARRKGFQFVPVSAVTALTFKG